MRTAVQVIYADFEFKYPNSYEKHCFEVECGVSNTTCCGQPCVIYALQACGMFTQRFLEQTKSDECREEWN